MEESFIVDPVGNKGAQINTRSIDQLLQELRRQSGNVAIRDVIEEEDKVFHSRVRMSTYRVPKNDEDQIFHSSQAVSTSCENDGAAIGGGGGGAAMADPEN